LSNIFYGAGKQKFRKPNGRKYLKTRHLKQAKRKMPDFCEINFAKVAKRYIFAAEF